MTATRPVFITKHHKVNPEIDAAFCINTVSYFVCSACVPLPLWAASRIVYRFRFNPISGADVGDWHR